VAGNRVDHEHVMTLLGEPLGVNAGAATDVEDAQRSRRQMASEDLPGAEELELAETLDEPDVRYFLAEFEGRPVAQCITFPLPARRGSFADTLHLSAVAVRESHRGRGVATALTGGALDRARRRGFRFVETNWRVTNRAAARYWTGRGYHPTFVRLHRTVGSF